MDVRYLIVPYALTEAEPRILLTKVQLIQTRARSKKIRGQIPKHAGQWILADGTASASISAESAAYTFFRERTGIDLGDPEAADRYGLSAPRIEKLQDPRYTPFTVFYIRATPEGLDLLAGQIGTNLDEPSSLADGVYSDAEVVRLSQAQTRIGPIPAPEGGWSSFIVKNYYGGQPPGALDTTYPTLVQQIAKRSHSPGELYLIALRNLPGGAPPPPSKGRLVGLQVENAEAVAGVENAYAASYHPGAVATIRAIVEPPNAVSGLAWDGGEPDPTGRNDCRIVPLGQITRFGQPIAVSAALGTSKRAMSLIIRPLMKSSEVVNAQRSPEAGPLGGVWVAEYSEDEPPIRIAITTIPDTAEAHGHLQWTGGAPDPDGQKNCRIIPRNRVTGPEEPVRVRVAVNPWWDFILYVLPRLHQLDVVAGPGIYNVAAGDYEVDYQAVGTYTIRATTWPDIAVAYQALTWSTGAAPGPQIQVPRSVIDNAGAWQAYSVGVQRQGVTLRSLTVRVRVQPTITSIAFSGYVFDGGGGNWYSYAADGLLGLPVTLSMFVTAQTAPSTQQAWAHLAWQNISAQLPAPTENVGRIDLNAARNIVVGARVGQAAPHQLPLDIRQPQAWPVGGPRLRVDRITFGGPGSRPVLHDDPAMVRVAFSRDWTAGTAHADQSPLTYTRNTNVDESAVVRITAAPAGPVNVNIRATAFVPRHDNTLHRMERTWNGNAIAALPPPTIALANNTLAPALPDEVVYADPMFMFWEMQVGAGPWILFDVTSHMLYVTLDDPANYRLSAGPATITARPYFTLLALSCRKANGDTTEDAVVTHIFEAFSALHPNTGANTNFERKGVPLPAPVLTYWEPEDAAEQRLRTMLANAQNSGSCKAWAEMFICMAALHGIATLNLVEVEANTTVSATADSFLVSNWTFHAPPPAAGDAYTHAYKPNGPRVLGNATWGPGLVGQNNDTPPPAFQNHYIVRHPPSGRYFDPSYGSGPHATWQGWTAVAVGGLSVGNQAGFAPAPAIPPAPANSVTLTDLITGTQLN